MKENLSVEDKENLTQQALSELKFLRAENKKLKGEANLVGVRWFGHGTVGFGLTKEIRGSRKLILDGYGDKGILDSSTWNRIFKGKLVQLGILVRDDSVIEELQEPGEVYTKDKEQLPNSLTDEQVKNILTSGFKEVKKVCNQLTYFAIIDRFLTFAEELKIKDKDIFDYLGRTKTYLTTKYVWGFLDKWELYSAAEDRKIPIDGRSLEEIREDCIKHAIKLGA